MCVNPAVLEACLQVFAALLHLMPQVGRQVSGGQITAPNAAQTHQSLVSQHAKLILRQEQLLQYQQRLLLSHGNAAGRIPFPPGMHITPSPLHGILGGATGDFMPIIHPAVLLLGTACSGQTGHAVVPSDAACRPICRWD